MVQGADVAKFYSTLGTHSSHSSTVYELWTANILPSCLLRSIGIYNLNKGKTTTQQSLMKEKKEETFNFPTFACKFLNFEIFW